VKNLHLSRIIALIVFFCWVFCPENAIIVDGEKIAGINYDYCKGCGICVNECPVNHEPLPLVMVEEKIEL
jgi:pyruvate ferredoxin oxidoreductase delta subunit